MKKIIVEKEYDGYEIGNYLKEKHEYSSRRLRNLEIYLNGKRIKNNSKKIRKLNRIVIVEKDKTTNIRPIKMDLKIVYEDENLLVVNKDPFLVVHPTQKKTDITLANGIVYYFQETIGKNMVPRFFNRLDMDTSGLIIITKNAHTQTFLSEKGEVKKKYMAIVDGIVEKDNFLIDIPIGKVGDELKRIELSEKDGGKHALTAIKVLKRDEERKISLVEAELFTGRTHQIRAHLSIIGHTIVGDKLYGSKFSDIKRQLLHSYSLNLKLPDDNKKLDIKIELPDDMKNFLKLN